MQEASGAGEYTESLVECGVSNATEYSQLTEWHRTARRFERGGDALVDGDRDGDGFDRSVEYTERESGAVLLELDCEGGW